MSLCIRHGLASGRLRYPEAMDHMTEIKSHLIIRIGTELVLHLGTRRVRVLTLPSLCNNWRLIRGWIAYLDDDDNASIEWSPPTDGNQEELTDH
jgi:hypothetical protein